MPRDIFIPVKNRVFLYDFVFQSPLAAQWELRAAVGQTWPVQQAIDAPSAGRVSGC